MRFLCFHGRGTNAEIFKVQIAAICDARSDDEFIFINGSFSAEPAIRDWPSKPSPGPCWGFWPRLKDETAGLAALHLARDFIDAQGPFEGLIGFSEGASIVAALLIDQTQRATELLSESQPNTASSGTTRPPSSGGAGIKCAIFFCGMAPPDLPDRNSSDGIFINIPTAHIWSKCADAAGEDLLHMCSPSNSESVLHSLGHEIPGLRSDEGLRDALRAIERTVERAKYNS